MPTAAPPAQPSPTAPTLSTPTMGLVYVRSITDTKGTTPITKVTADDGAKIVVVPASITGPGDLADITLKSTLFDLSFSFTFPNVPLVQAKDGTWSFTLDPTDKTPGASDRFAEFYSLVQSTILAKLPVNADPRTPIVWNDPVHVQLTRIFPDVTAEVAAAKAADDAAQAVIDALNKSSKQADALAKAARDRKAKATAQADQDAAQKEIDSATAVVNSIQNTALPDANKVKAATADALTKAVAAGLGAGPTPAPFDPAPRPDARKKDKPQNAATDLNFLLREAAPTPAAGPSAGGPPKGGNAKG